MEDTLTRIGASDGLSVTKTGTRDELERTLLQLQRRVDRLESAPSMLTVGSGLTLLNGWTEGNPISALKFVDNTVMFSGYVNGAASTAKTIFTLPAGWIPLNLCTSIIWSDATDVELNDSQRFIDIRDGTGAVELSVATVGLNRNIGFCTPRFLVSGQI